MPPGPPVNLTATKIGKDFVNLEWKHPKDDGGSKITKYAIKSRKDRKSEWQTMMTIDGSSRSFKATDLKEGTEYYFAVSAENKAGFGKMAEISEAILPLREASKENILFYLLFGSTLFKIDFTYIYLSTSLFQSIQYI